VHVEVSQVEAAAERPVAEHLEVDERALAVQDGRSVPPWLGERAQRATYLSIRVLAVPWPP